MSLKAITKGVCVENTICKGQKENEQTRSSDGQVIHFVGSCNAYPVNKQSSLLPVHRTPAFVKTH